MTTAACSIRAATARCSTCSAGSIPAPVATAWAEVERLAAELAEAREAAAAAERDRDWLEHAAKEIAALAPEPGEETRAGRGAGGDAGRGQGRRSADRARRTARRIGGRAGPAAPRRRGGSSAARPIIRLLAEALASLDRALIEASEAEDRIARAAEALAFDPARLEAVEARLFDIRGLARKHRVEPDALAALGEELTAKLALIEAGGERIAALEAELASARARYDEAALSC